ncbi:3-hydroxyacyl-CoA dehydrogenase NAD-binding domain-containing protein [Amycolatopsis sp. VS8301801F10]|uniref:3-hydroxyacyl-CoA dehydrogenase NAD-binding domain-containing protein n=1 Tax=Amycolatopsis sp. VS8301801F10 TaxID=2652442 RepID=UPI0038FCA90C
MIAIVGAGRMGEGIALAFLAAGHPVLLADVKDRTEEERQLRRDEVRKRLADRLRAMSGHADALESLTLGDRSAKELADATVVFEAVPEVMDIKREVFGWLGSQVPESAVLASTTSTFLVTQIAELADRPERVVNAHWLNPAELMPLVEVSRSDDTDPAAVDRLVALLREIGKVPVVCGPAAGYIVPRLQALLMNEAARMVEEGVAGAAEIDLAVRAGLGPRFSVLGPLEFIDWGGGDILYYASRYLTGELGERFQAPAIVEENMTGQRRGLQDGAGFYRFDPDGVPEYRAARMREFEEIFRLREPHLRDGTPVPERPEK